MSDSIENEALNQLERCLLLNGKSLKDFSNMPLLSDDISNINNNLDQLIWKERSYDIIQLEDELYQNVLLLNED